MSEQTEPSQEAAQEQNGAKMKRVTAPGLRDFKRRGEKIVVVTAYDYPSALLADRSGVDIVLVGDSVQLVLGYDNTLPVTLEEILHHTRAVQRGLKRALLVADMPFGTYQASPEEAIRNAMRLLKEGGAQAVKIEGGAPIIETARRMTDAGIPVFGHLGLTPQSIHVFGGHRLQGKDPETACLMIEAAKELEAAGVFGIVLETIPAELAARITAEIAIPTIGIGAGPACDGQVQVWHDLLGLFPGKVYRHVKRYAELDGVVEDALRAYADEVRQSQFPTKEHSF